VSVAANVVLPLMDEANSAPPNLLAGFEGHLRSRGREGKGKEGRGKWRKEKDRRDGRK